MPRPAPSRPTDAELGILQVLWARGPSTVREVFDILAGDRDLGYTTVLKTIQIMTDKGLVVREEQGRNHIYRATAPEEETQRHLLGDQFLDAPLYLLAPFGADVLHNLFQRDTHSNLLCFSFLIRSMCSSKRRSALSMRRR